MEVDKIAPLCQIALRAVSAHLKNTNQKRLADRERMATNRQSDSGSLQDGESPALDFDPSLNELNHGSDQFKFMT